MSDVSGQYKKAGQLSDRLFYYRLKVACLLLTICLNQSFLLAC